MTLADLKRGQHAVITDVSAVNIPQKLLDMGCLPGHAVELVQVAPFADPICFRINGTFLAIRKETAMHVLIAPVND